MLRYTLGLNATRLTGAGVVIAVIDSGVGATTDLLGRVIASYDFTGGGKGSTDEDDDGYGHGTHIAGTLTGSGRESKGKYAGLAQGARLVSTAKGRAIRAT